MFFCKNEKKKKSPYVIMAVTALAVVGAIAITNEGKRMFKNCFCSMKDKMMGIMKKEEKMVKDMVDCDNKSC